MSQQPQGSLIDRIIDWWKRLFGPPTAGDAGTSQTTSGSRDIGGAVRGAASKANTAAEKATGTVLNKVQEQLDQARGTTSTNTDKAKSSAEEATSTAAETIADANESVTETVDNAVQDADDSPGDVRGFATEKSDDITAQIDETQTTAEGAVDDADQGRRNLGQAAQDKFKTSVTDRITPLGDEVDGDDEAQATVADTSPSGDGVKASATDLSGAGRAATSDAFGSAQAAAAEASKRLEETTEDLRKSSDDLGSSELFLEPADEPALPETPPPDVEHSAIVEGDVSGTVEDVPTDLPDDDAYDVDQVGDALSSDDVAKVADSATTDGDDEALVDPPADGDEATTEASSPSGHRKRDPGPTPEGAVPDEGGNTAPEGYPIKGNASSHIYHLPGESSYEHTNPEFWFSTEEAARAAGYRPRKR